jgi:hypothetical protein
MGLASFPMGVVSRSLQYRFLSFDSLGLGEKMVSSSISKLVLAHFGIFPSLSHANEHFTKTYGIF